MRFPTLSLAVLLLAAPLAQAQTAPAPTKGTKPAAASAAPAAASSVPDRLDLDDIHWYCCSKRP